MSPEILCATFQSDVRAAVEDRRDASGLRRAFAEVGRMYGLTERRVRACWHGEVRTVSALEWHTVRTQRQIVLQAREERLSQELAAIQQRIAALEARG